MTRILLIDDDNDTRENLTELLELEGYDVFSAANGLEGIKLAKKKLPDLIICDVRMPVMNGYEVLESMQADAATKSIPFIFCTASAQRSDIEKGTNAGAFSYLTKPIKAAYLFKEIELFSSIR